MLQTLEPLQYSSFNFILKFYRAVKNSNILCRLKDNTPSKAELSFKMDILKVTGSNIPNVSFIQQSILY
jgi:hypothetical protein